VAVRDDREVGVERLLGADHELAVPFAGRPERAAGVVGIAFFGGDEVQLGDAERRGVAQNVAGRLGAGQTETEGDRSGRGRGRCLPGEGEREGLRVERGDGGFAARAIDHAAIKRVANAAPQHAENVQGAQVGARERSGGFGGSEENEIHVAVGRGSVGQRTAEAMRGWRLVARREAACRLRIDGL
jgi:hypothetical protein